MITVQNFIDLYIVDTTHKKKSFNWVYTGSGTNLHVFVSFVLYELELKCTGLDSYKSIFDQLKLDIPRCSLFVDGDHITSIEGMKNVPIRICRLCTQASMAFPVELIAFATNGIVAELEKKRPMLVEVWGNVLFLQKRLRLITSDNVSHPFLCCIIIDISEPNLLIEITFE